MVPLNEIETYLNGLLGSERFRDYVPNGVQVRGERPIGRVVSGVSACMDLFQAAVAAKGDLILAHHGMFWDNDPKVVQGALKRRLKFLLDHDLSLMAYHLPLDAHAELGNNAQILKRLALQVEGPFGDYRGQSLSFMGHWHRARPFETVRGEIQALFGGEPLVLDHGPKQVKRVAVCSGGAPDLIREAVATGADLYLTGEATEYVFHIAREEGIHFIAAGHHRTETLGVQALGEALATQFGLEHQFIDIANPI